MLIMQLRNISLKFIDYEFNSKRLRLLGKGVFVSLAFIT